MRILLILLLVLASSLTSTIAYPDALLKTFNAETGTVGQCAPTPLAAVTYNCLTITNSPVQAGTKAYSMLLTNDGSLFNGEPLAKYRTEMRGIVDSGSTSVARMQFGHTYYVRIDFFQSATQWPDDNTSESWPIQLHEVPSSWTNWGVGTCQQSALSTAPFFINNQDGIMSFRRWGGVEQWNQRITKGVWHKLVIHIKLSTSSDGFVESWIDGVAKPRYTGITHRSSSSINVYCGPSTTTTGDVSFIEPQYAFGLYKWPWKNNATSNTNIRQGYLDNLYWAEDTGGGTAASLVGGTDALAGVDTTPPVISAISETSIGTTNATINFTTDEAATTTINYGVTTSYGTTYTNAALVTTHTAALTGLIPNTQYNYQIQTSDSSGNIRTQANRTFTTAVDLTTVAPIISSVVATPTSTDATVTWSTNESATSRVLFSWDAGASSFAVFHPAFVTSHSVTASEASDLPPATLINYKVTASDVDGNLTDYFGSFTTDVAVAPVLNITNIIATLENDYIVLTWTTNKAATTVAIVNGLTYKVSGLSTTHTVRTSRARIGAGTFSVSSVTAGSAESLTVPNMTYSILASLQQDLVQ